MGSPKKRSASRKKVAKAKRPKAPAPTAASLPVLPTPPEGEFGLTNPFAALPSPNPFAALPSPNPFAALPSPKPLRHPHGIRSPFAMIEEALKEPEEKSEEAQAPMADHETVAEILAELRDRREGRGHDPEDPILTAYREKLDQLH